MYKAVVLMSGGLDSSVLATQLMTTESEGLIGLARSGTSGATTRRRSPMASHWTFERARWAPTIQTRSRR